MKLAGAIQEGLLALLAYDEKTGQLVSNLVPSNLFDPVYSEAAEGLMDYVRRYKKPPGEHTWDIFETCAARNEDQSELFTRLFESVQASGEEVNAEYVVSQAQAFMRYQRMKRGLARAVPLLQRGDVSGLEEAESVLAKTLETTLDLFNPGSNLLDFDKSLAFLRDDHQPLLTGIPELDHHGLGPCRKKLYVFMGLSGAGKSWHLVHLAKQALAQHLKVLYVTLEIGEAEVCQRLMQSLFALTKRKGQTGVRAYLKCDELGRVIDFDTGAVKRPFIGDRVPHVMKMLKYLGTRASLYVKEFPTGALTPSQLSAYLDALAARENFIPDLILVDYGDLMAADHHYSEVRHNLGSIFKSLRGIAVSRNIAMATATQSNRDGRKQTILTDFNMGEDYSKAQIADVLITYNQTPMEHLYGLARLFVAKGRNDADKFQVLITQSYATGQFCLDSARSPGSDYHLLVKSKAEADGDLQDGC